MLIKATVTVDRLAALGSKATFLIGLATVHHRDRSLDRSAE
jgi:hypothetical protein